MHRFAQKFKFCVKEIFQKARQLSQFSLNWAKLARLPKYLANGFYGHTTTISDRLYSEPKMHALSFASVVESIFNFV